jgi:hypothetical protein
LAENIGGLFRVAGTASAGAWRACSCLQPGQEGPWHWRRPDDSNRVGQPDYADACAWLPPALSPQAEELLASGEKIAQEHLGLQALLSEPTLMAGLAS